MRRKLSAWSIRASAASGVGQRIALVAVSGLAVLVDLVIIVVVVVVVIFVLVFRQRGNRWQFWEPAVPATAAANFVRMLIVSTAFGYRAVLFCTA